MCSAVFQWAYCVLANANIVFVCMLCANTIHSSMDTHSRCRSFGKYLFIDFSWHCFSCKCMGCLHFRINISTKNRYTDIYVIVKNMAITSLTCTRVRSRSLIGCGAWRTLLIG